MKSEEQERAELKARAVRLCSDEARADDLVQEAYVRKLRSQTRPQNPWAWMLRIMTNLFLDEVRQNRRKVVGLGVLDYTPSPEPDPPPVWHGITNEELLRALDEINPKYAAVLRLYYFEHKSHAEIAKILNIATRDSTRYAFRGREQLLKILRQKVER